MHRPDIARALALVLALLLVVTSSGMPSHDHGDGERTPVLADPDHHDHGVQLVDQSDRVRSEVGSAVALPPAAAIGLSLVPVDTDEVIRTSTLPVMGGRAPPPSQPRAPPVSD